MSKETMLSQTTKNKLKLKIADLLLMAKRPSAKLRVTIIMTNKGQ